MTELENEIVALRRFALFRGLSDPDLGAVKSLLTPFTIDSVDGILFDRGAESDGAWLLRQGLLRVEVPRGEDQVLEVARLGPGTVVGEACLLDGGPRGLRVRALEPSRLWRLDLQKFRELKRVKNPIAYKIIRNVALTICDRLRYNTTLLGSDLGEGRAVVIAPLAEVVRTQGDRPSLFSALRGLFGGG
jgi:CRP-like cAMP-binding protein